MLLVLEQSVSEGSLSSIVRLLGERINWLGTRSYLPPDVPLKTLILLSTLLQVLLLHTPAVVTVRVLCPVSTDRRFSCPQLDIR